MWPGYVWQHVMVIGCGVWLMMWPGEQYWIFCSIFMETDVCFLKSWWWINFSFVPCRRKMAAGHLNAPHYVQDIMVPAIFPGPRIFPPLLREAGWVLYRHRDLCILYLSVGAHGSALTISASRLLMGQPLVPGIWRWVSSCCHHLPSDDAWPLGQRRRMRKRTRPGWTWEVRPRPYCPRPCNRDTSSSSSSPCPLWPGRWRNPPPPRWTCVSVIAKQARQAAGWSLQAVDKPGDYWEGLGHQGKLHAAVAWVVPLTPVADHNVWSRGTAAVQPGGLKRVPRGQRQNQVSVLFSKYAWPHAWAWPVTSKHGAKMVAAMQAIMDEIEDECAEWQGHRNARSPLPALTQVQEHSLHQRE